MPSATTASSSTVSEIRISGTATITDRIPKPQVETVGVRKRWWTLPITDGIAPHFAIDSVVRAVGRIVVCVEAAAEVSTAMIRNLTPTDPRTPLPSACRTSLAFSSLEM